MTIEGECLARQMRLAGSESSRRIYYGILSTVGKLCDRYFPHDREMPPGREAKQPLIDEASTHPILFLPPLLSRTQRGRSSEETADPEDGRRAGLHRGIIAPALATTAVRAGSRPEGGTGTRAGPSTGSRFKPADVAGPSTSNTRPGTVVVAIPSRRTTYKGRAASQPHRNRSRSASTETLSSQARPRPPKAHNPSQRAHDDANAPANSNAAVGKGSEAIKGFLRTLPQDLGGLLPLFLQYGVGDGDALRGMLRMPAWRSWLYSWVKEGWLTELQFRMVCDGLAQLVFG
ncbi:hypothetical protein C8Q70DRAFT_1049031 [Cubamyces menziesii]|nr:hypothetical protein C8Q70DRAFT_1049031 [Cubamyces menziesii]